MGLMITGNINYSALIDPYSKSYHYPTCSGNPANINAVHIAAQNAIVYPSPEPIVVSLGQDNTCYIISILSRKRLPNDLR